MDVEGRDEEGTEKGGRRGKEEGGRREEEGEWRKEKTELTLPKGMVLQASCTRSSLVSPSPRPLEWSSLEYRRRRDE
jgi:hypothetical protein